MASLIKSSRRSRAESWKPPKGGFPFLSDCHFAYSENGKLESCLTFQNFPNFPAMSTLSTVAANVRLDERTHLTANISTPMKG